MKLKPFLLSLWIIHFSVLSQTNKVNYSDPNQIEGIPSTISYQGVLKNEQGVLAEGRYVLIFSIYSSESGAQSLWSEIHDSVEVNNGIINVLLGSLKALVLPFDRPYSLGIKIGTDPELIPRIRFSSTPYSLSSKSVIGLSNVFPSEGSVGIGTDDPAALLHVAGDAIFDGNINVNGMLIPANDTLMLGSNLETAGNILSQGDLSAAGSLILKEGNIPAEAPGYGNVYVLESDSKLYYRNAKGLKFDLTAGDTISPGEINTASNVGAGGVGLYRQKLKTNLEFKNINAAGSRISIYDDEENGEIDIDVIESSLDLNKMKNILDVAKGGTGSKDAENARINLGLTIGSDIQAYHKVLDSLTSADRGLGQFLVGDGTAWVSAAAADVRTSLELGTLAVQDSHRIFIKGGEIEGVTLGTNNPGAGTFLNLQSGTEGRDGLIRIYSEQGIEDFSIEFNPADNMTQNTAYTLPVDLGSAGQVLKTNGSGALSWSTVEGTVPPGTTVNNTLRWDGTGWVESAALVNDNTDLTASGDMTVKGGTLTLGAVNSAQAGAVILHDGSTATGFTTTLAANPALTAGFTLTLPADDGIADQLLSTNGTGLLTWVNPFPDGTTANNTLRWNGTSWVESAALVNDNTDLTASGDVTVKGGTLTLGAGNSAQAGAVILHDGSTATGFTTTLAANPALTAGFTLTLPADDGIADQLLSTNGTGLLTWVNPFPDGTTANNTLRWNGTSWVESAALVNDNTDLTASGDVTVKGGTLTLGAGNSSQAGAVILHDGSTATGFTTTLAANPALTAGFTLTLPADDGIADQLLSTNGTGLLTWVNPFPDGTTANNTLRWNGTGWVESGILTNDGNAVTITNGIIKGANSEMINLGSDNDVIVFTAGGAEKMRIHSNGNIGIGTSNPGEILHIKKEDNTSDNVTNLIRLEHSTTGIPSAGIGTGLSFYIEDESGINNQGTLEVIMDVVNQGIEESSMVFKLKKAGVLTEIMRMDGTNGYVGIGNSNPGNKLSVTGNSENNPIVAFSNAWTGNDADVMRLSIGASVQVSTNSFISFYNSSGIVGAINGSSIGVTFSTTSDGRLKENIKDTHYNLSDLRKIRVRDYNWIGFGKSSTGFIAQELYEIFPEAVIVGGENPQKEAWSVDYGKLTPLLVKSVQDLDLQVKELQLQNKNLLVRIEALEKSYEKKGTF